MRWGFVLWVGSTLEEAQIWGRSQGSRGGEGG